MVEYPCTSDICCMFFQAKTTFERAFTSRSLLHLSTASYAGIDASGQGSAGLLETPGETALVEGGTEPGDDGLSIHVQVSDNGYAVGR